MTRKRCTRYDSDRMFTVGFLPLTVISCALLVLSRLKSVAQPPGFELCNKCPDQVAIFAERMLPVIAKSPTVRQNRVQCDRNIIVQDSPKWCFGEAVAVSPPVGWLQCGG